MYHLEEQNRTEQKASDDVQTNKPVPPKITANTILRELNTLGNKNRLIAQNDENIDDDNGDRCFWSVMSKRPL